MDDFAVCYSELMERFKHEAEKEGSIYLPSIRPEGQVAFVLIGMEPSLKRWAKGSDEAMRKNDAREKIEQGFKDFMYSLDDFILHYCVKQYLCSDGYYVTNLAKGAMPVSKAQHRRQQRYDVWLPWLRDELKLVAKHGAKVIPIGKAVYEFLHGKKDVNGLQEPILHYSGRAARHRTKCIRGHEAEFDQFKPSLSKDGILEVARRLIRDAQMHESLSDSTLERIRHSNLSESRKMLIFGYKRCFERIRSST